MIPSTLALFLISGAVVLVAVFQNNSNFFDIRGIIFKHIRIFKENKIQGMVFFFIPLLLSLGILKYQCLTQSIIENINITLSILISAFFAIASVLCGFQHKNEKEGDRRAADYNRLLNETFISVLFEALLSILILVLTFIQLFIGTYDLNWFNLLSSFIIYYLFLVVVLNVFIVFKRLGVLFGLKP